MDSVTSTTTIAVPVAGYDISDSAQQSVTSDLPRGVTALTIDRGPDAGTRFLLVSGEERPLTIGRDASSDIFLDDVTVSRSHATVKHTDAGWLLIDAGSLNGSYVNGSRAGESLLRSGDVINIGKFRFIVSVGQ